MSKAKIYYYDIGDYLSREEKLKKIKEFKSFANMEMTELQPNEHGDWISQRCEAFGTFIPLGDKDDKTNKATFYVPFYSNGLKTQRDAWCYNSSLSELKKNISTHIDFYNQQRKKFIATKKDNKTIELKQFIDRNSKKISWTTNVEADAEKNVIHKIQDECFVTAYYRPFFKQYLYFSRTLNERVYQIPKIFPNPSLKNLVICVSGVGGSKDFTAIIAEAIPDVQLQFNGQAFPLYYYEERTNERKGLFDEDESSGEEGGEYIRRDGVSDFILERARKQYGLSASSKQVLSKEDIFYYVYGFLHSPQYRETFASDLKKMLSRLPLVEDVKDFWAFSKAGRQLAELHINYEKVPPLKDVKVSGENSNLFTVEKMRFPSKEQKDTILFNSKITVSNIPDKAYEYVVNGKSAIEWIMERYQITTHKESGIQNNPNDWSKETNNERYILDLLLSIIHLSTQTVDIIATLPPVKFE